MLVCIDLSALIAPPDPDEMVGETEAAAVEASAGEGKKVWDFRVSSGHHEWKMSLLRSLNVVFSILLFLSINNHSLNTLSPSITPP